MLARPLFGRSKFATGLGLVLALGFAGCFKAQTPGRPGATSPAINIEGSSTVFPISQAMAINFGDKHDGIDITVAGNGTSNGFKRFILREVEICDASRPIADKEKQECQEKEIDYLELQIAIDGLTVAVNKDNDWVDTITVADLKKIWDQDSPVQKWSDVRPEWPDKPLKLLGPGPDSGTFDYFTEVVNGQAKRSRGDYTPNENDNVLVTGVSGDKHALAYFGFAYYVTSADKLKALKIAREDGAEGVAPTQATIESGEYAPLSRPLFIYVDKEALKRPELKAFVEYYLSDEGQSVVEERKYIRLPDATLQAMRQRFTQATQAP